MEGWSLISHIISHKPKGFAQIPLPFDVAETSSGRELGQALGEGSCISPCHLASSEVSSVACPFVNTSFSGI